MITPHQISYSYNTFICYVKQLIIIITIMIQYEPIDKKAHNNKKAAAGLICLHVGMGGCVISLVGSMMHFIYQWSGCSPVAAVFCAVNESVYEHAKIMLFPILFWWCLAASITTDVVDAVNAATYAVYAALGLLLLGNSISESFETLAYDISLFVICIFFGQCVALLALTYRHSSCIPLFFLLLIVGMLFTFTFATPHWAYLFEEHRNKTYGLPANCSALPFGRFK